jgi:hypothetical protein
MYHGTYTCTMVPLVARLHSVIPLVHVYHGTADVEDPRVAVLADRVHVYRGTYTWYVRVCPGTQRDVDQGSGTTPGLAAEAYAAVKAAKYADQDNFIPLFLETGGRVNKAARDWLDALIAPETRRASAQPGRPPVEPAGADDH